MKKIIILISIFVQISYSQYALNFDGANDYVEVPDNNNLDLTNNYTLEAWIKPNTIGSYEGIVSKYHSQSPGFALRVRTDGIIDFNDRYTSTNIITTGTWYHVAAVDNNGTLLIYVNGVSQSLSGTAYSEVANSDPVKIGADWSRYFDGSIDEVRIWNVARTQAQIKAKMYSVDSTTTGLVAYYKCNTGSGTTLTNSVSGGASGTLTSGPTWVSSPVQGIANALKFDGTNDYVNIPDHNSLDFTSNYTLEAWIKSNTLEDYEGLISKYNNSTGPFSFTFRVKANGSLDFNGCFTSSGEITNNNWYHVAAVDNNGTLSIYVNGVSKTLSGTSATFTVAANSDPITIGKDYDPLPRYFDGQIDEVRIWNLARTASEISNNYSKEIPITTSGLVAYYSFNQGIADGTNTGLKTLIDNASTNNGTLTNFALTSTTSNYVAQYSSITTDASTLLPVELKNFTARTLNNNVILNWKTVTETNNSGFEVERSARLTTQATVLRNWEKVAFVRGSGTSSVEREYNYTDNNLRTGKYSYRLKQIDLDGTTEYSQVKEVEVGSRNKRLRTNPNPFNSTTIINFEVEEKTEVTIKLYDLLGRVVAEILNNEPKEVGEHEVKFNANHLTSGVYLLKFQTNKNSIIEKLVLMK